MDVREKMVELLDRFVYDDWYSNDEIAEELIANGVTVQEWISVNDRLPTEEAKAYEKEWCEKYPEFIVMIERGLVPTTLYYDWRENEWFRELGTYKVTHWMPLPAPPKGE